MRSVHGNIKYWRKFRCILRILFNVIQLRDIANYNDFRAISYQNKIKK